MASMKTIPQDIISTHILHHLPSKSVGRFRCVSKEWLSLLSDPRFIETHQKTLNKNRYIFESDDDSLYSVSYNNHEAVLSTITKLPLESDILYIHGSVNGLVLASPSKKSFHNTGITYLVLNPTTKDYVELPICQEQFWGLKGFGYDSVSGDYKLVVFSNFQNYNGNVYVYNLRTNIVKQVMSHSPYIDLPNSWLSCVFINGFLHWILTSHSKPVIVVFSLADEKLSELPPPNLYSEVDMTDMDTMLVALDEKLAIVNGMKGYIWLMNEYGVHESWTKIVLHGFNEFPMVPDVFYDDGKILFLTSDRLWIFHVEERNFCKSVDISYMNVRRFIGCAYAESLVSPPKFSTSK